MTLTTLSLSALGALIGLLIGLRATKVQNTVATTQNNAKPLESLLKRKIGVIERDIKLRGLGKEADK